MPVNVLSIFGRLNILFDSKHLNEGLFSWSISLAWNIHHCSQILPQHSYFLTDPQSSQHSSMVFGDDCQRNNNLSQKLRMRNNGCCGWLPWKRSSRQTAMIQHKSIDNNGLGTEMKIMSYWLGINMLGFQWILLQLLIVNQWFLSPDHS